MGTERRQLTILGLVGGLSLLLAGCNGGNGSGSVPTTPTVNAPVVSNFEIRALTPEVSNRRVEWRITATVVDPNNDVMGGRVETRIVRTNEVIAETITADFLRGDAFAAVLWMENPPPGRMDLVLSVVDAAGNRSNEIPFVVNIAAAELRQGTTPGTSGGGFRPRR